MVIVLEDQFHAEWIGEFTSWDDAFDELNKISQIAWNESPNRCPCTNWKCCHRDYELIGYETSSDSWVELNRLGGLEVSAKGVEWYGELSKGVLPNGYA